MTSILKGLHKRPYSVILPVLIFLVGCHKISEVEEPLGGGLHVISAQDFATVNYISDIPGARSLLIYPGNIIIASTDGVVYRYDSESMTLVDVYNVGSPSLSGFTKMAFNPDGNSAYLIASNGQIVEISLPDCSLTDVFSVCQSPVTIAVAPGLPSHLYVADGPTNTIHQVSTSNNSILASEESLFNIQCIEAGWVADNILVGTSHKLTLLQEIGPGSIILTSATISGTENTYAIASIPYDSAFVLVSESGIGVLEFFEDPGPGAPFASIAHSVELEGSNHFMAIGTDWQHAYVLSYMGDFTSRLTSYNYAFNQIDQQVDIPGFPLDIKTTSSGNIYVLTYE